MGGAWSQLRDVYCGISALLNGIAETNADFAALLTRINSPEHPVANPNQAFWQENPIHPELVAIRSEKLPETADIVIIGSGISGASIAHTILTESKTMGVERNVILVEARTICSGATGRNGGHIKVSPYREFSSFKERFGEEIAKKMLKFQMLHLPILLDLARMEKLEAGEVREVQTVDAFIESTMWEKAQKMVEELKVDMPEAAEGIEVVDVQTMHKIFGFGEHCLGGIAYKAGALWPYRFITSLYAALLSEYPEYFSIETGTLIEKIDISESAERPFLLQTSRGSIAASHVVHATNSFSVNLLPGLLGKIFPVRGHMSAQRPGKSFPHNDGAKSWSIIGKKGFDYITQRPGSPSSASGVGGEMMLGGGLVLSEGGGIEEFGQWKDNITNHTISSYLSGLLSVTFNADTWGEDADGSRVKQLWTGCMGFTADLMPFVGKLEPGLTGRKPKVTASKQNDIEGMPVPAEWISAGFNGEGMVQAWLSGVATALMLLGRERIVSRGISGRPDGSALDWLPEQFLCTEKRIAGASIYKLSNLL